MARYRGPRIKICRALGDVLPGLTNKKALARPYRPGQHGLRRGAKASDYKERLMEKQKLRYHYGVLERQFKKYVTEAVRRKGHLQAMASVYTFRLLGLSLDERTVW